uniref:Uncharacterized protein n=1 Tax=Anguilla anguilla TaxID=7936 RepID=A0A0E9SD68_ANGAN
MSTLVPLRSDMLNVIRSVFLGLTQSENPTASQCNTQLLQPIAE